MRTLQGNLSRPGQTCFHVRLHSSRILVSPRVLKLGPGPPPCLDLYTGCLLHKTASLNLPSNLGHTSESHQRDRNDAAPPRAAVQRGAWSASQVQGVGIRTCRLKSRVPGHVYAAPVSVRQVYMCFSRGLQKFAGKPSAKDVSEPGRTPALPSPDNCTEFGTWVLVSLNMTRSPIAFLNPT